MTEYITDSLEYISISIKNIENQILIYKFQGDFDLIKDLPNKLKLLKTAKNALRIIELLIKEPTEDLINEGLSVDDEKYEKDYVTDIYRAMTKALIAGVANEII